MLSGCFGDTRQSSILNFSRFTGKERDSETGLDYFGARYYASNMGRWMSPDWAAKPTTVPYAEFGNPQSLNLYGYVGNNPLARADLEGHKQHCIWVICIGSPDPPPPPATPVANTPQVSSAPAGRSSQNQAPREVTVGVGLGGNAEIGVGLTGAGVNGSINGAISMNGKRKVSAAVVANNGAVAYAGKHVAGTPPQNTTPVQPGADGGTPQVAPMITGVYGGFGVNFFAGNTSPDGLRGTFQTESVNIGVIDIAVSFQHSYDQYGNQTVSLTVGPGAGFSVWNYTTDTVVGYVFGGK